MPVSGAEGYNITFNGSQHGLLKNLTLDLGRYGLKCNLRSGRNFLFIRQFLKGTDFTSSVDSILTSDICLLNTDTLDSISIFFLD
jgi:hypothetical protein